MNRLFSRTALKATCILLIAPLLLLGCGGSGGSESGQKDDGIVHLITCFLTFFLACKADTDNNNYAAAKVLLGPGIDDNASYQNVGLSGGVLIAGGRSSGEDADLAVVEDVQGDRYVTGFTSGSLNGGWYAGGVDAYVVKYDASGAVLWSRQFGTDGNDVGYTVAMDLNGGVLVAGYTSGDLSGQGNAGKNDVFIIRFDGDGNHVWTRQAGTAGDEAAYAVTVDSNGIISVAAVTFGNFVGAPKESDARKVTIVLDYAGDMLQGMQ
jgi:hypothetical protein